MLPPKKSLLALLAAICAAAPATAWADDAPADTSEDWAIHGQATVVEQYHPAFRSPYRGPQSMDPGSRGDETVTATAFAGLRLWDGAQFWVNGEIDQGFGLSNSLGIAAFPNGEAYKIGSATPYPKLPRAFLQQTFDLGGETKHVDADINQLAGDQTSDRIVITVGKMAVADVFDHNEYSDDARHGFLNWALVDLGSFDYAANAWGYTYGGAFEWYQDWWAVRAGLFDLSDTPNSSRLESTVGKQFQFVYELEEDHTLLGQPGSVKLLGFLTHGMMGTFSDAIALSQATGEPANTALVRHVHERAGIGFNIEQHLSDDVGVFSRFGYDDPSKEPYEFIDSDFSASVGASLSGARWGRKDDTFGIALIADGISREHAAYLNDGGLGILVGDGKLPHYGAEKVMEALYTFAVDKAFKVTADYQFADNPAYNTDRGPISIFGVRLHTEM